MCELQHPATDHTVYQQLCAHTCTADGLLAAAFDGDCVTLGAADDLLLLVLGCVLLVLVLRP